MKTKKFLFAILAVAMLLGMMSFAAFAEDDESGNYVAQVGEQYFETLRDAIDAAADGGTVKLLTDTVELSTDTDVEITKAITLDLDKKTLDIKKISNKGCIVVNNHGDLTIKNGNVTANDTYRVTSAVIAVNTDGSVTLDSVNFVTTGAALYPSGDAAKVSVINGSKISAPNSYAVATNASSVNNYNVIIELKDSALEGNTPVLINVPGKLTIDRCNITGIMQGVVVRGGTADIKNSTIVQDYPDNDFETMAHYFDNRDWGQGNMVNLAAITIGNKDDADKTPYRYPSDVTITNSNVEVKVNGEVSDAFPCVYAWPMEKEKLGVTLDMQDNTLTGGTYPQIVYGNPNATVNGPVAIVSGKVYATLQDAVDAVQADDTITLLTDLKDTDIINIENKDVTIDLNDHNIGFAFHCYFSVNVGKLHLTGKGTAYEQKPDNTPVKLMGAANDAGKTKLVVDKDVTLRGWAGVFITQNKEGNAGIEADIYGTLEGIKDYQGGSGTGFYINGSITQEEGRAIVHIHDGATVTGVGDGIYAAGNAEWIIDGSVTGTTSGIEIRAGKLTVNETAEITSTAGEYSEKPEESGSTTAGAAVAVSQHTTEQALVVIINGGIFNGPKAFVETDVQDTAPDKRDITVVINGGTFNADVQAADPCLTIYGGSFKNDVSEYLADGYIVEETDGIFTVKDASAITWTTATDAGYYMGAETNVGMMRFLFSADVEESKVTESGIKYIKADTLAIPEYENAPGVEGKSNAFYGDIINIPEGTSGNYYAAAYVTVDGVTYWSKPLVCTPSFNKHFTAYNREGDAE